MASVTPLRRELLIAFGVLFAGGILVAAMGMAFLLPLMDSGLEAFFYILSLLLGDLLVVAFFGRILIGKALLEPMDRLVEDVRAIASGSFEHRIQNPGARELQSVADSVNALAERLIQDQESLAANVRSLDKTNQALVEARAQVVRAARMASTGTLASGIAHELGNPLGALLAYVDVARARAEGGGMDTELLDSIREEAVRIDRIIRSLLDFARSGEGETALQDVGPVIWRVRDLLEAQGRLEGTEVEWQVPEDGVPEVFLDPTRLEQVLLNLLLNALDVVEGVERGWIRVRLEVEVGPAAAFPRRRRGDPPGVDYAHRRRLVTSDEGMRVAPLVTANRVVVVTVEDNGPGIPTPHLEEVFDPFFTTKEPGKGTGLGLALSAQLVEGMGGEIQAANREEGGAVFTIRIPDAESFVGRGGPFLDEVTAKPGEEALVGDQR
ncbi:MAG: sensor histidine kinase [Longimicrobiales bacterium]